MMNKLTIFSVLLFLGITISGIAMEKPFTILHTTDEHSFLLPAPLVDYHPQKMNPSVGGFARISTLVNTIRMEKHDQPVLLISSGDYVGGTPFSWLILEGYSPEIEIMKAIGYDAIMIGNHEFDYEPDALAEYFKRAGYPDTNQKMALIASNLMIPDNHALLSVGILENKITVLDNGLSIGMFGILGEVAYSVAPAAAPITISDPFEVARQQVSKLKEQGADVIIAITHGGIEDDRIMAQQVDGIDVILGGHDHVITNEPEFINGTFVFHSGNYLNYLGQLEFVFDSENRELTLQNSQTGNPILLKVDATVEEDPAITTMVNEYTDKLNAFLADFTDSMFYNINKAVMWSDFAMEKDAPLKETTVGNFVTDAMRLEASKLLGKRVDLAFQGNGIIRGDIIPGTMDWSLGHVSFFDLVSIAGLGTGPDERPGYPLASIYLTEAEIYTVFEIAALLSGFLGDTYFLQMSGVRFSYDANKTTWLRIPVLNLPVPSYRSVRNAEFYLGEGVQGNEDNYREIDKNGEKLYHVVTDYYLASFLPMVGEMLPKLTLVLKDEQGNPVELEESIILHEGQEFKVWEAVARYAMSFDKNESGLSVAPSVYGETQGRIVKKEGTPLALYSYAGLALVLAGLGFLVRWIIVRIRRRK